MLLAGRILFAFLYSSKMKLFQYVSIVTVHIGYLLRIGLLQTTVKSEVKDICSNCNACIYYVFALQNAAPGYNFGVITLHTLYYNYMRYLISFA